MKTSPFDDDDGAVEESPQLPAGSLWRRPWWRWNLFTLFAVLFVYIWVREFLSWSVEATILGTATIISMWTAIPLVPSLLTVGLIFYRDTAEVIEKYRNQPKPPKFVLILVARWLAVLVSIGSVIQLMAMIVNFFSIFSPNSSTGFLYGTWQFFYSLIYAVSNSVFYFGMSITLWMLADILQNQEEMKFKQNESE